MTAKIARRIRAAGPMSVAAFMAMALHDPDGGYYSRRAPIGRAGDFITAPEISQIFGELIGLWCADYWHRIGRPDPVVVAELGPGSGALIDDFLRAAASVPDFYRAVQVYLVEASPVLREMQQRRLAAAALRFVESVADLPRLPLLLIANEFLDALPVRQLVRGRRHWAERLIGVDGGGRFGFVDGPESRALGMLVPADRQGSIPGTVVEICPAAASLAAALGTRLTETHGAALFIDYGYCRGPAAATLAGIRDHQAAPILDDPGFTDLSAHVDFAALRDAGRAGGAAVHGPAPQGRFLTALGAAVRLEALSARATPAQRAVLDSGLQRLIDPRQMGTLFKAMAFTSPGLPVPAGFVEDSRSGA